MFKFQESLHSITFGSTTPYIHSPEPQTWTLVNYDEAWRKHPCFHNITQSFLTLDSRSLSSFRADSDSPKCQICSKERLKDQWIQSRCDAYKLKDWTAVSLMLLRPWMFYSTSFVSLVTLDLAVLVNAMFMKSRDHEITLAFSSTIYKYRDKGKFFSWVNINHSV